MKTKKSDRVVCSNCGGENIEAKAWVNLNTGEYELMLIDEEDYWCNDCEGHHKPE